MKTRSNHIGGWRWRLRLMPWANIIAVSWAVLMFAALVVVLLIILTGEAAS